MASAVAAAMSVLISFMSHPLVWCCNRRPAPTVRRSSGLNVTLLGGLFVAWIDDAIDDDGAEQDRRLDQVLVEQRNVDDGHGVQENADQRGTDQHIAHPAPAARQADA